MTGNAELMKFDDFIKLPSPPGSHLELHHGHNVLVPHRKRPVMELQQGLYHSLLPFTSPKGFAATQFPFRPAPEFEFWQADIGFVTHARWEKDDDDYFGGAPDLVIDVGPKEDTLERLWSASTSAFKTVVPCFGPSIPCEGP